LRWIKRSTAATSNNDRIRSFLERTMYERILVPMDGSVTSINGLHEAIRLARGRDSQLVLLHVIDDFPTVRQLASSEPLDEQEAKLRQAAEQMLRGNADAARTSNVTVRTHVCKAVVWAPESIVESAGKFECGLIVMGTHGRSGVRRAVLGSVAEQVSRLSRLPVMLVPSAQDGAPNGPHAQAGPAAYERILVPVDGSPTSNHGLDEAIRLARQTGATLGLVHVVDLWAVASTPYASAALSADLAEQLKAGGQSILDAAKARVEAAGGNVQAQLLDNMSGRVCDTVIDEAQRWKADLIVIGTHGRRGVSRLALGSDAEQITRASPVPVLLVRHRE
jgi:nucleotide-binding universal stress UspA family protein